jgi:type II secretory pathway pseudopilin PulG
MSLCRARRDGFTLAETVVAILTGSVAVMALASGLMATSRLQEMQLSRSELSGLAESRLEQLRLNAELNKNTQTVAVGGSLSANTTNYWERVTTPRGRQYDVRWQVANAMHGMRLVTVRVVPLSSRNGELQKFEAQTYVRLW